VLPDLYLGNFKDARDREQLAKNNITHILSIHDTAAPILEEMTYLCIPAADSPSQNLIQHFKKSIKFIHESRLKGEGCLEALAAVKLARPGASPNLGFQNQLQEFEAEHLSQFREWLREEYKQNPFNDEDVLRSLLSQSPPVPDDDKLNHY
ncbi:hypothetical protein DNTS_003928, partial [Danionella cerebrum]